MFFFQQYHVGKLFLLNRPPLGVVNQFSPSSPPFRKTTTMGGGEGGSCSSCISCTERLVVVGKLVQVNKKECIPVEGRGEGEGIFYFPGEFYSTLSFPISLS